LCIALSLVVGLTGGADSRLAALGFSSMLIPAVGVLVVAPLTGERPIVRAELPLPYLAPALLLIPLVFHAVMLPVISSLRGLQWQPWLTPDESGLFQTPASVGWSTVSAPGLMLRIGLNALIGLLAASTLAWFEEVGWRAWLLPQLGRRLSVSRSVVVTAAVWALWHVPFQLSGIQHVDGLSRLTLTLLMPAGIFASGLVIGWLWTRTESVWVVALAHGSLNNWGQYALKFMPDNPATGADVVALVAAFGALLVTGTGLLTFAPARVRSVGTNRDRAAASHG
jgi:membrane protease YdiL (CAAX protease family)